MLQILHESSIRRSFNLLLKCFPVVFSFVLARIGNNEQASCQCNHEQDRQQSCPEGWYVRIFYHIIEIWCKDRIFWNAGSGGAVPEI